MATAAAKEPVGMARADLKRLLRLASKDPIHAAFALGGDGKPIVILDKRKQPRALEKSIKDQAPEAKNSRWGTVSIDPNEPKLARFMVNKAASGMARKLVIALKGTGCNKVQILLEDGTPVESCEGEPEEDQDQEDQQSEAAAQGGEDAADDSDADSDPDAAPPSGSDPAPTDGQPDAATLTGTLTALVKRMMDVIANDPSKKAALAELATDAQASLKRGDLAQAAAGIDVLQQAIDGASGTTSAGQDQDPIAGQDSIGGQDPADSPATASADTADTDDTMPQDPASSGGADPQSQAGPSLSPDFAPPTSGQDAAGLMASLTAVVKRLMPIVAADPSQRDALKGIVAQAQASLKSGDLQIASGHVDSLQAMLAGGGGPGAAVGQTAGAPAAATNGAAPQVTKASLAWVATRKKIEADLAKLKSTVMAACQGVDIESALEAGFREKVEPVLGQLDESLAQKLQEVNGANDAAQREKLVREAKGIIQRYQAFVASSSTIAHLDANPFVPLTISKTLTATLSTLDRAVH